MKKQEEPSSSSSLRSFWIYGTAYLAIGPICAPLPLMGCSGGLLKGICAINLGPLFVLHLSLLVGYASLLTLRLVSRETLKIPSIISAVACIMVLLPSLWTLSTVHPEFATNEVMPPMSWSEVWHPPGVSFAKWASLPTTMPPELDQYTHNVTSVYRRHLPEIGPYSRDDSFLNPVSKLIFQAFPEIDVTELKTYFFPVNHTQRKQEKPGIVIFVHGGGWWSGHPLATAATHAKFAHKHGYSFATLQYRLGKNGWNGEVQVEDVKAAIQHVLQKHGKAIDTNKVVLCGSSAGAHLALTASYQLNAKYQRQHVKGVIAFAPSTSIEIGTGQQANTKWTGAWSEKDATTRFCAGMSLETCHAQYSPVELLSRHTPTTILVSGTQDEYYNRHHARALARGLSQHGIAHVHMELPFTPHILEIAQHSIGWQKVEYAMEHLLQSRT